MALFPLSTTFPSPSCSCVNRIRFFNLAGFEPTPHWVPIFLSENGFIRTTSPLPGQESWNNLPSKAWLAHARTVTNRHILTSSNEVERHTPNAGRRRNSTDQ